MGEPCHGRGACRVLRLFMGIGITEISVIEQMRSLLTVSRQGIGRNRLKWLYSL